MTLTEHAKYELELAGFFDEEKDFFGGMSGKNTMALVETFAKQSHSGMSGSVVRELFHTLSNFAPLTPLTGEPDEWKGASRMGRRPLFQNKRCSRVFAEDDHGKNAYDVRGKVFADPEGYRYTNNESHTPVAFPYIPHTEYINVESSDS